MVFCREGDDALAAQFDEGIPNGNQRPNTLLQQCSERRSQLGIIASFHNKDVAADFRARFKLARLICSRRILGIDQDAQDRIAWYDFAD